MKCVKLTGVSNIGLTTLYLAAQAVVGLHCLNGKNLDDDPRIKTLVDTRDGSSYGVIEDIEVIREALGWDEIAYTGTHKVMA